MMTRGARALTTLFQGGFFGGTPARKIHIEARETINDAADNTLANQFELGKKKWNDKQLEASLPHFENMIALFKDQDPENITPSQAKKLADAHCRIATLRMYAQTKESYLHAQEAKKLDPTSIEANDIIAGIESEGLLEFEQREKTAAPPKPRH